MPDNSTDVKVGKLIALIVEKGDDWKSVEVPKTEEKSASPKEKEQKSTSQKSSESKKEEKPKSDKQPTEQSQYVFLSNLFKTCLNSISFKSCYRSSCTYTSRTIRY